MTPDAVLREYRHLQRRLDETDRALSALASAYERDEDDPLMDALRGLAGVGHIGPAGSGSALRALGHTRRGGGRIHDPEAYRAWLRRVQRSRPRPPSSATLRRRLARARRRKGKRKPAKPIVLPPRRTTATAIVAPHRGRR